MKKFKKMLNTFLNENAPESRVVSNDSETIVVYLDLPGVPVIGINFLVSEIEETETYMKEELKYGLIDSEDVDPKNENVQAFVKACDTMD